MLKELTDLYRQEDRDLAPYAVRNSGSRGRRHPETAHPFRSDFQRDRDRILHSRAFRRLEYKTQVFLNGSGDHYRTRLTHTIEVAAIARTMARTLYLNEDLAETIALAHDLGHTPFGHAGERRMQALLRDDGGFDHNAQALKVVDELEIKYPSYNGLNLCWEVRSGLIKHRDGNTAVLDGAVLPAHPFLEAQVADLADDLAYYGHDVDDGLDAGLLNQEMLMTLPLWRRAVLPAEQAGLEPDSERYLAFSVRNLIDMMVGDAIRHSADLILASGVAASGDVERCDGALIAFSPEFALMTGELHDFLFENVYFHPEVIGVNHIASDRMENLFRVYIANPELLGDHARSRMERVGVKRAAADYIAGMTDRFAMNEYLRLCEHGERRRRRHSTSPFQV
ncbi:MAG: deoxyguanosinetriphosphate triphosphohydrolase [Victivallales bacterium]|nr:deoxyguanosinetriphosphate triphosphohydrolase [Victivallales bacterium]